MDGGLGGVPVRTALDMSQYVCVCVFQRSVQPCYLINQQHKGNKRHKLTLTQHGFFPHSGCY